MSDCLFCIIIDKKIPAKYVRETSELIAIRDVNPQAPVHILIIPKKHIPTLNDITDEDCDIVGKVHVFAKDIAKEEEISIDGYRLVLNVNRGAGQSVFHIHWHLLGGREFNWPPG
ncbi:MAG: histidine triad nucleotide-binding protein [Elusimicrobia bacterium RIFOXYD2_FULL_34_15]|nr:MAG: histidine triad nucleotide-binding protein [Elusimicrobia bacterium RIFOXYD2_FULL_34_15]